jgi:hypothetical protein
MLEGDDVPLVWRQEAAERSKKLKDGVPAPISPMTSTKPETGICCHSRRPSTNEAECDATIDMDHCIHWVCGLDGEEQPSEVCEYDGEGA